MRTVDDRPTQLVVLRIRDAIDSIVGLQRIRDSGILAGLVEPGRSNALTVVSELASNIHKHAGRGTVQVERVDAGRDTTLLIEAMDDGPGIEDLDRAMQDHFSTAGTLGLGLPGVRRMAHAFSITAPPDRGTHVKVTLRFDAPSSPPAAAARSQPSSVKGWEIGSCVKPLEGAEDAGDLALARNHGDAALLVLVDGTGHGPLARRAASLAEAVVDHGAWSGLEQLLQAMHRSLSGSVGAAVGALLLDRAARRFAYAAVGNTVASRVVGEPWRGISREGMVGSRMPTITVQEGATVPGDVFVMWSDGIASSARSITPSRVARRDPTGLAREIVVDHGRPHDDASCIVARWSA